jgi:hypothetical protein
MSFAAVCSPVAHTRHFCGFAPFLKYILVRKLPVVIAARLELVFCVENAKRSGDDAPTRSQQNAVEGVAEGMHASFSRRLINKIFSQ